LSLLWRGRQAWIAFWTTFQAPTGGLRDQKTLAPYVRDSGRTTYWLALRPSRRCRLVAARCHEKRRGGIPLVPVRDQGVAGSNPVSPTTNEFSYLAGCNTRLRRRASGSRLRNFKQLADTRDPLARSQRAGVRKISSNACDLERLCLAPLARSATGRTTGAPFRVIVAAQLNN
jgi:hypothetical protein